jgi:hypothetical protein
MEQARLTPQSLQATGIFMLASTVGALLYALAIFEPNTFNGGSDYTFDVIFSYNLDKVRAVLNNTS